jgi:hypothetical protein
MIEWLLSGDLGRDPVNLKMVLLSLLLAFISGQILAWTYMVTHSGLSYSRTYVNSIVLIPFLVAMVMMVLSNNLVTAFGLMALFAIVRFRNILRDTLDTCYILAAITVGMAAGTQRHGTAILGLAVMIGILLYLWYSSFGSRHRYDLVLNLHWARPLADLPELMDLLRRHSRRTHCASQHSHDGEAGADLSYRILLRDPGRMDELFADLRALHGASRVTGLTAQDESEV